jgi:hypothetical protein
MIFADKKTGHDIREQATEELTAWAKKIFTDGQKYPEADPMSVNHHIDSQVRTMPPLVAILLYKSGIIGADMSYEGDKPHYPVVLYHDQDHENKVTLALGAVPGRLIGGLVEGLIHT